MFVLFLVGAHWSVLGQNKTDAAGRKQGPWIKYQGDGTTPLYTGTFKDNIPVGEFRYFYPSGKVKMIVKHETKDRSYAWFYSEKEDLMSEGQYLKMKKDSVWKNYAYDGALLSTETYRSDQLHGERKVFYTQGQMETGEIKIYTVERYLNNQLDGSFEAYKMSGSLEETGLYVKNLKGVIGTDTIRTDNYYQKFVTKAVRPWDIHIHSTKRGMKCTRGIGWMVSD